MPRETSNRISLAISLVISRSADFKAAQARQREAHNGCRYLSNLDDSQAVASTRGCWTSISGVGL